MTHETAAGVTELAANSHPQVELFFDDQCFAEQGHFAGSDERRAETFISLANDPQFDVLWFARGGYGAARIASSVINRLDGPARDKIYLGYSDGGNLLAALYRNRIGKPVHGPMPADFNREGGEDAINRVFDWLVEEAETSLEPSIEPGRKYAAFNLVTLSMMIGTDLLPDLQDHVLMIEEVSEYLYAFDRAMFHVTSALSNERLAGIQLGRVSDVPQNDREFGMNPTQITEYWCDRNAIAYLGRSDIGHDAANKIVPFGSY